MSDSSRRWLRRAAAVTALVAAHWAMAQVVARADPLAVLLTRPSAAWLLAVVLLLVLRVVLIFLLPGWVAWLALSAALARWWPERLSTTPDETSA